MQRFLAAVLIIATFSSCSESPPTQPIAPTESATQTTIAESAAQTTVAEIPAADAQAQSQSVDVPLLARTTRLKVGDQAPKFSPARSERHAAQLGELVGPKARSLWFFTDQPIGDRSVASNLVQLQKQFDAIAAINTQVVAISYDSVEVLKKFARYVRSEVSTSFQIPTVHSYERSGSTTRRGIPIRGPS